MKIHPVGACGQTDTHDEANHHFSQLCKSAKKYQYLVRNPVYYIKGITFNYVKLIIKNYK
jgi:hypothetical protein